MRAALLCLAACLLSAPSTAQIGTARFALLAPAAGAVYSPGDTMRIRWEHDTTVHEMGVAASFDDGELWVDITRLFYHGDSMSLYLPNEAIVGVVQSQHVGDTAVRSGIDWLVPDSFPSPRLSYPRIWPPLPDSGVVGLLKFSSFTMNLMWTSEALYRVVPTSASATRRPAVGSDAGVGKTAPNLTRVAFDLRGRSIPLGRVSHAPSPGLRLTVAQNGVIAVKQVAK
jgi:hypothetical protein